MGDKFEKECRNVNALVAWMIPFLRASYCEAIELDFTYYGVGTERLVGLEPTCGLDALATSRRFP